MKLFNYKKERKRAIDHDTRIQELYFCQNGKEKTIYIIYVNGTRIMRIKESEYYRCGEEALLIMAKALARFWEERHQKNNQ